MREQGKRRQDSVPDFLPATHKEMRKKGWDFVDVVLITGDAYIDHPSFGVALIGRWLEYHGYRVAILSQPRYDSVQSFQVFGKPRLFWGITGGNLDSIVANYTGNGRVRDQDSYSKDGNPYFGSKKDKSERRRPDRATIRYANLAKAAYKNVPVVLGGLEASLRRFVHYDYQQNRLRGSVLADAKADILVYGMAERAVVEIARRISTGRGLDGISGTCVRLAESKKEECFDSEVVLQIPSWQEIQRNKAKFLQAELKLDKQSRAAASKIILQRQQSIWVAQYPSQPPLDTGELDRLYQLPFVRAVHPDSGDVPAWRMIRHSLTIVRGCSGNCSFCAITRHQGPIVTSRSRDSILREAVKVTQMSDFKGTISDLGGPTANLYGVTCEKGGCRHRDCLYDICRHLRIDEDAFLRLFHDVADLDGVKHVYVSSGLRMELLLKTPRLLAEILSSHTPGVMKIAPEHTESHVLRLMHKQKTDVLPRFLAACRNCLRKKGKKAVLNPYIISAHPGCTEKDMASLAKKMKKLGLTVRQLQDFTPTPGTLSTAMYVSGLDRDTQEPVHVPRGRQERRKQRQAVERGGAVGRKSWK